jgi:hypothetical protein
MSFENCKEAIRYIFELRNSLKLKGEASAGEFLEPLITGEGASTSTEAMAIVVDGLKDFLVKYDYLLNDLEKIKIKHVIQVYRETADFKSN